VRHQVVRVGPALLDVRIPYSSKSEGFHCLLASDIHLDNPKCNRTLLARHLNECRDRKGAAFMFGDVLCLMQGKTDRRGSKGSIRPEHLGSNYFDLVFGEAADFLRPWVGTLAMISDGNHETAVAGRNEVNPLDNVIRRMGPGAPHHMPYQGFVRFSFYQGMVDRPGKTRSVLLFFHHGAWGGVVTKGVMGGGRYAILAPQASIWVNGHNHERTIAAHPCYRVTTSGQQQIETRWHLQTGTYKEEFASGGGWAVEKIVLPKSLGGIWLTLRPRHSSGVDIIPSPAA
jgi:hypothetical protein